MKQKTVQFTVSPERGREIEHYAQEKGFRTSADLARYALVQHMKRYPVSIHANGGKRVQAVQPDAPGGDSEVVSE